MGDCYTLNPDTMENEVRERCPKCGEVFDPTNYTGGFHCPPTKQEYNRMIVDNKDLRRQLAEMKAENAELEAVMNFTLVGYDARSFARVFAALGERAWSCFCDKHGSWAISLIDGEELPVDIPQIDRDESGIPYQVYNVVEGGEMTFSFEDIVRICGDWLDGKEEKK